MREFDDKLDALLRQALHADEEPGDCLDYALKRKLSQRGGHGRTISLWWLPMLLTLLTGMAASMTVYLLGVDAVVREGVFVFCTVAAAASALLTLVGLRCFDLKKGAVIAL